MKRKKQSIDLEQKRFGLFISNNSINLDIIYGRNYLQTDNIQEIILHKINIIETKSHSLYGQTKPNDKKFLPPVKLSAMVTISESKQEYYGNNNGIIRNDIENIRIGIYLKELEEKQTDIDRGDIIEYNMSGNKTRYFEVTNANYITDETKKTIGGFIPYWKLIIAIPVKEDVVPFLNETNGD